MSELLQWRVGIVIADDKELKFRQRGPQRWIEHGEAAGDGIADVHRLDPPRLDRGRQVAQSQPGLGGEMAHRHEAVAGRGAIAPARHPRCLEAQPRIAIAGIEPAGECIGARPHVGCALGVGGTARTGNPSAWSSQITGDDGQVDAGRGDLRRVAVLQVRVARSCGLRGCLVDERRRESPLAPSPTPPVA